MTGAQEIKKYFFPIAAAIPCHPHCAGAQFALALFQLQMPTTTLSLRCIVIAPSWASSSSSLTYTYVTYGAIKCGPLNFPRTLRIK